MAGYMQSRPTPGVKPESIFFNPTRHYFESLNGIDLDRAAAGIDTPLSVILQVTRRCNFDCAFCSETVQMEDPTFDELRRMKGRLRGVQRVFLSGGEPLIRKDFVDVASMFAEEFIVGLPTNATPAAAIARQLVGKVAFVNVGLEGPRATTNRVRGDYDKILRGVYLFREVGLPLSFSAVVLRSTMDALPFTCQIADVFEAGKVKLIMPIRKGNGLFLNDSEFLAESEADTLFQRLAALRRQFEWRPSLRMTTWTPENEGYSILIYPNGQTYAWPVYDAPEKVELLGNVIEEPIQALWQRYRFKRNHLSKYLGRSIRVTAPGSALPISQ